MELLITLAMKFWQWSILIAVVIITSLINLLDKKKSSNLKFSYKAIIINCSLIGKGFFIIYIYNKIYSNLNEKLRKIL